MRTTMPSEQDEWKGACGEEWWVTVKAPRSCDLGLVLLLSRQQLWLFTPSLKMYFTPWRLTAYCSTQDQNIYDVTLIPLAYESTLFGTSDRIMVSEYIADCIKKTKEKTEISFFWCWRGDRMLAVFSVQHWSELHAVYERWLKMLLDG